MLVNWNLLVSAVKLVNFERVACSFVGVTCSFDAITFRFQNDEYCNTYTVAEIQLKRWGGGRAKLCEFPTSLFWFCTFFILILYWSNCLIRCVCKKSFLSYPYFSMVIKKYAKSKQICRKFAKLPPPLPLQLNFRHCICVAIFIILESQNEKLWHQNYKLWHQNYKLRPQNYKLRVQNLQVWQLTLISFNWLTCYS